MLHVDITEALKTGFETVGTQLMVAQAVAILEIIHPLVGLVKTSAIAPFLQVNIVNIRYISSICTNNYITASVV